MAVGLRILHALAPAEFGGLERVVELLTRAQRDAGHEARVLATLAPDAPAPHPFLVGLERRAVPAQEFRVPGRAYRAERLQTIRAIRAFEPDIVHTHGYRSDVLTAGWARKLGCGTVSTVHGFTGGGLRNRIYEWLQIRALRRVDAVVAVSRPLLARLTAAGVPAVRIHCVPNAWQSDAPLLSRDAARQTLGLPAGTPIIGWVGRLSWEKGPDVLVRALGVSGMCGAQVAFIGSGPMAAALRDQASQLGVKERIRWVGSVPDAGRYFAAFDCFVMSSRTEGTPMALFEAMASGAPIVATRVGGIPDVVSPEEAQLIPAEDPAALAQAIEKVLGAPADALKQSRAAEARLRSAYAVAPWVAAYDVVYRQALSERKPGRSP